MKALVELYGYENYVNRRKHFTFKLLYTIILLEDKKGGDLSDEKLLLCNRKNR